MIILTCDKILINIIFLKFQILNNLINLINSKLKNAYLFIQRTKEEIICLKCFLK